MKNINWTYIIIALILGLAVVGYGTLNFITKQNQLAYQQKLDHDKIAKLENGKKECLVKAEKDFKRVKELNSEPAPTKEYPDARRWNSIQVSLDVEAQYNKDREFCLSLYK